MRVYTEVIFEWDEAQGKLVETSSQSEEYSGDVALCEAYTGKGWKFYPKRYYADTSGDGSYDAEMYIDYYVNGSVGGEGKEAQITKYRLITLASNGRVDHWSKHGGNDRVTFAKKSRPGATGIWYRTDHEPVDKWLSDAAEDFNSRGGGWPSSSVNWTPDRQEGETEASIQKDDPQSVEDLGVVPAAAEDSLRLLTEDWGRIASGDSEYHRSVQAALDDLDRANKGIEGEEYLDPLTQLDTPILGDMARAQQEFETSTRMAQEDYATDLSAVQTEGSRELGGIVTDIGRAGEARDTGLEAAREGFTPAIRQAEAAAAATGFAGTGVGEVAREALAEELMGDVGMIETGFGETRADLVLSGQQLMEDVGTDIAGLETTRGRALETAGTAIGGAEAVYAGLKANLDQIKTTQHKAAQNALRGIQTDMAAIIADTRTTMDTENWNPFTISGSALEGQGEHYGWLDPGFDPTAAEGMIDIEGANPDNSLIRMG